MRHLNQGRKLNRSGSHRKALMRNLVLNLIRHGREICVAGVPRWIITEGNDPFRQGT